MKCSICKGEATCTIKVKVSYKPYEEDKHFCETHGGRMETILGVKRNG